MNVYHLLADAIALVHLVYVSVVVLGQLAIMIGWALGWRWVRNPWFRVTHLVMILIVAMEATVAFECPLTTWESHLRDLARAEATGLPVEQGHDGRGFIERCIWGHIFAENPRWQGVLDYCYYGFAGLVLATLFLVPPRFRKKPAPAEPAESPQVPHASAAP